MKAKTLPSLVPLLLAACAAPLPSSHLSDQEGATVARALVEMRDDRKPAFGTTETCVGFPNCLFSSNVGLRRILYEDVAVTKGDVLHVTGHLEWTSEHPQVVGGNASLAIDGQPTGWNAVGYNLVSGNHHQVLKPEALWIAPTTKIVRVELRFLASREDASPQVIINFGNYTSMQVARYSSNPQPAEKKRYLQDAHVFTDQLHTSYGVGAAFKPLDLIKGKVPVALGDLVQLAGQATSMIRPGVHDMLGVAIRLGSATAVPLSTWATANHAYDLQTMPLGVEAFTEVKAGTTMLEPRVTVHGVNGNGGNLVGGGFLHALRFGPAGRPLANAALVKMPQAKAIPANAGEQTLFEHPITLAPGDVVRATAAAQILHPAGFSLPVSCATRLTLTDKDGRVLGASSAQQYTSIPYASINLRATVVAQGGAPGPANLKLTARCSRQGASPVAKATAAGATILQFGNR